MQWDYNGSYYAVGTYFFSYGSVPPAGHYSFPYTLANPGTTHISGLAFNCNTPSGAHWYSIDNLKLTGPGLPQTVASYTADITSHTDYYPFGQSMPGRTWVGGDEYRYSHNGHEKEDAIFAGAQSAEYWMYDSRIGRRWEMDPIRNAGMSPYAAFANNPVLYRDIKGLKPDWGKLWQGFKDRLSNFKTKTISFFKEAGATIKEGYDKMFKDKDGNLTQNLREVEVITKRTFKDRFNHAKHKFGDLLRRADALVTLKNNLVLWGTGLKDGLQKFILGLRVITFDVSAFVEIVSSMKSHMTGDMPVDAMENKNAGLDHAKDDAKEEIYDGPADPAEADPSPTTIVKRPPQPGETTRDTTELEYPTKNYQDSGAATNPIHIRLGRTVIK